MIWPFQLKSKLEMNQNAWVYFSSWSYQWRHACLVIQVLPYYIYILDYWNRGHSVKCMQSFKCMQYITGVNGTLLKAQPSKKYSVNKYSMHQSTKIRLPCFDSKEENNAAPCLLTAILTGNVSFWASLQGALLRQVNLTIVLLSIHVHCIVCGYIL